MKRIFLFYALCCMMLAVSCSDDTASGTDPVTPPQTGGGSKAVGTVTCEGSPVAGALVSDGINVVETDGDGHYELSTEKESGMVFITPPAGYVPMSADGVKPDFYQNLKADFSTETHDFELRREDQSTYTVLFVTDLHLTNADFKPDIQVFRDNVMPNAKALAAAAEADGPVYTMNLGDLSHERWWYKYSYTVRNAYNTLVENGWPTMMWSIPGNHDNDSAVRTEDTDWDAGHLYRAVLGPEYYSVNIGNDHWVMMDNIIYENTDGKNLAVGAVGTLDYSVGFTDRQMEWLANDLAFVPSDKRIILCTHASCISDTSTGYTHPQTQMNQLARLLQRFSNVIAYSGHNHRMHFFKSKAYTQFDQGIKLPATSGDMWESSPNRLIGCDGEDGGIYVLKTAGSTSSDSYHTHLFGEKYMRVYDMNTVAQFYNTDEDVKEQMETYPLRLDYGDGNYADQILVNYWMHKPGESVQVWEDGVQLTVKSVSYEDPLFNISYHIRTFRKELPITPGQKTVTADHMFVAQASTADKPVTVRVVGTDGNIIREVTVERPKAFGHNME